MANVPLEGSLSKDQISVIQYYFQKADPIDNYAKTEEPAEVYFCVVFIMSLCALDRHKR